MLNKVLYNQLEKLFGSVKIANEGEPFVVRAEANVRNIRVFVKDSGGEEYHVCCPICGDKRYRLYINHMWGNEHSARMKTNRFVHCFNEGCDAVSYILSHLGPGTIGSGVGAIEPVKIEAGSMELARPLPFPEDDWCTKLTDLPESFSVINYLKNIRKFNPKEIQEKWGVTYAHRYPVERNGTDYSWLGGRLFIPAGRDGWQAREIEGVSKLKYVTCPGWKKTKNIYNLEEARKRKFCILAEGVTDVWRIGKHGIAIFGKCISKYQVELLAANFQAVGVVLDADAYKPKPREPVSAGDRTLSMIFRAIPMTFKVKLNGDRDPAKHAEEELWKNIYDGAAKIGLTLEREGDVI